ncbi:nucleotidyltransferase domain-containing protein [Oscillatoria sp. FACHB-1407]|uniref:nucleotidyltransferase domain-containing protein n=1 Tax=Oscillatoria sp. FACHB-1407 TaxID=2692847 RepID=UPI0035CD0926
MVFSAKRNCKATALGGSRARGNHTLQSDVDMGIYYQPGKPPDLLCYRVPLPHPILHPSGYRYR